MARGSTRRDLFLQVSGTVDPLKAALKGGSTALIEFAGDAEKQMEAVERSLREMASDPAATAKQLTQNYKSAFQEIRRNAQQVLSADSGTGAMEVLNANASRAAADAAERRAAAIRVVADAARAEAVAQGSSNAQLTQYAAAAMIASKEAEDYAIALRQQANTLTAVEGRMDAIVAPGKRITEMSGQARAGMQQLSYQLGDVATQLAAGTPPTIVFAQQIGQVTQAIGLMTTKTGGFLGFIGGPWGIAISSAMVLLTPFVGKLFEGGDATDKLKDKSLTLVDALSKEKFGTEQATKALKDFNDEKERARKKDEEATKATLDSARARLNEAIATREQIKAELDRQRAASGQMLSTNGASANPAQAAAAAALVEQDKKVAETREALNNLQIDAATRAAKAATDPIAGINQMYDEMAAAAKRAAAGNAQLTASLAGTLTSIERRRKSDIETEQKRQSAQRAQENGTERRRTNKQAFEDFERELAERGVKRAAGRTGFRTAADQNQIHRAGESPLDGYRRPSRHQSWQGFDPSRATHSDQAAYEAAQAAGLKGFRIVSESGGRKHYEWKGAGKRGDVDVATGERGASSAESAEQREANRRRGYESQLNQAQEAHYRAQLALVESVETRADLELEQVRAARIQADLKIDEQVKAKQLTAAEAAKLKALSADTLTAQELGIERREELRLVEEKQKFLDRDLARERAEISNKGSMLQLQADLATTTKERHRIALELLELELQERREIAKRKIASDDPVERREGRRDLKQIGLEEPLLRERLARDNEGPLDSYRRQLIETTDDMGEALEGVAVRGFGALEEAGAREMQNLLKLKGAFGQFASGVIADLARIALQKGFTDLLGLIGIGGNSAGGLKNIGNVKKFAGGGRISGPGTGTSDSILALIDGRDPLLVSNGESIVTAEATRKYWPLIDAMNKGRVPGLAAGGLVTPSSIPRIPSIKAAANDLYQRRQDRLQVDLRAKIEGSELLNVRMEQVSARTVGAAAEPMMAGAETRTIRRLARPALPGGHG